jgi:threonyl-tRNA synthetase
LLLTFDDSRGRDVFWHSSAHVLGSAVELELGVEIATSPATENSFFSDFEPPRTGDELLKLGPEVFSRT